MEGVGERNSVQRYILGPWLLGADGVARTVTELTFLWRRGGT